MQKRSAARTRPQRPGLRPIPAVGLRHAALSPWPCLREKCQAKVPKERVQALPVASQLHGIAKQQRHTVPEHSAVEVGRLPGCQPAPTPVSVMRNVGEARECASGEHQRESGLLHSARKLTHPSHVGRDLARKNSCKIVRARAPVAVLLPLWHVTACDGGRGM